MPARRVRETREYLGIALSEVAATAGMEETRLREIETGERPLDELSIHRLARVFGCTPAYLCRDPEPAGDTAAAIARLTRGLTAHDHAEAVRFACYLRHTVED
ncbi:MAG: helix-turn-helix transcriptional regulator [Solirubrobacteraceae bacterium]